MFTFAGMHRPGPSGLFFSRAPFPGFYGHIRPWAWSRAALFPPHNGILSPFEARKTAMRKQYLFVRLHGWDKRTWSTP